MAYLTRTSAIRTCASKFGKYLMRLEPVELVRGVPDEHRRCSEVNPKGSKFTSSRHMPRI